MSGDVGAPAASSESAFALCASEPIHIPGAIQPHGALLAALADGHIVTHASANLALILGRPAEAVLGRPLRDALGADAPPGAWTLPGPHGGLLHLVAHRSGRHVCVDILPARGGIALETPLAALHAVLESFRQASGREELCDLAVRGLREITGYDQVIAYRFERDGHGTVIAESRAAAMNPYLGLHFPASDVPPQARQLYLRQRIGAIPDSAYCPVPLLSDPALGDGTPLDLTRSALRSVAAVHRTYMRNIKAAASLRMTLAQGEDLWGVLVCLHPSPRIPGPDLYAAADIIGRVVSLLLGSLGEAETHARQLGRNATLRTLIDRLGAPEPLPEVLAAAETDLLHLVDAAGAMVRLSGASRCIGHTPPAPVAEHILAALLPGAGDQPLGLDDLGLRHPAFAACAGDASGVLVLPVGRGTGDAILWFRPELWRTVVWGGNPAEHGAPDPLTGQLTPRASFAAWRETVTGRSAPWDEADLRLAGALRGPLEEQVAKRAKAELVRLRFYDPLTGLPNRSLLRDWLVEMGGLSPASAALLFIDIGQTKHINDTMGYAAGDMLLVEVARRLLVEAGPENLAARLDGAEFVVLLRQWERNPVTELGERIYQALAAPFEIAGRHAHISPTIRMVFADETDGRGLLGAVDEEMSKVKLRIEAQREVETQRQKMETLGRMMGGVAHELNNMLQPVTLLGQTIQKKGLFIAEGSEHLGIILDCTKKARQIIAELLAFSRPAPRTTERLDCVALLREALILVRKAIPPGIAIVTRIAGHPPPVVANRTTFAQILINLATNAAAAMEGHGTLTISLDEDAVGAGDIAARPSETLVRLCVSDTGCGMTKAILDRAFEPFFSTKAIGEGTGLGLPVVYGLVQEMGGTIALASEVGHGTTVTVMMRSDSGE